MAKGDEILGSNEDLEKAAYGSTKRVNKLPLIILIAVLCVVMIFIISGVTSRGSAKQQAIEEQKEQSISGSKTSQNVGLEVADVLPDTAVIPEHIQENNEITEVPAKPKAKELIQEQRFKAENNKQPPAMLASVHNPSLNQQSQHPPKINDLESASLEMQRQIMTKKRQAFELAVVSKTSTNFKRGESHGAMHSSESAMSEYDDIQKEIARAQARYEQINSGNYGGTQVMGGTSSPGTYNSHNDGVSGNSADEGYGKYDRDGNWTLSNAMENPLTPFVVRAGMVIPAVLISGVNSDVPGQIIGQVSQSVYDSATGKYLLIPQGTRLVGAYQSGNVSYGQERLMIAWQRLEFPDGKVLDLGSMPGADIAGYAGFSDLVDNHWWKLLSSAFLMSGITAGVSIATGSDDNNNNDNSNSTSVNDELRQALATQFGDVITKVIERNLNIAPTLVIRPGYRFNVTVTKDMVFGKPFEAFDYKF